MQGHIRKIENMRSKPMPLGQYALTERFVDWAEQLDQGYCDYEVGEIVTLISVDGGYMRFEQNNGFLMGLFEEQQRLFDEPIIVSRD